MIDYFNNYGLNNNYIPSNMNARYGPNYNGKCIFGRDYLGFGRFNPRLRFDITSNGIINQQVG
jgi:hypothetical protein